MEATAANKQFVYKADNDTDAQQVPSVAGYAVLLPTILSVMYGQGEWPENSVSGRYGGTHCLCRQVPACLATLPFDKQLALNLYQECQVCWVPSLCMTVASHVSGLFLHWMLL